MAGTWIDIGEGFRGYLAVPQCGSGPGLLLLQEIFGVNAHMRDVADLYAEEGYVVLAPDLFWRLEPGVELGHSDADLARAFALYERFDTRLRDAGHRRRAWLACVRGRNAPARSGRWASAWAACWRISPPRAAASIARSAITASASRSTWTRPASIACPLVLHFGERDEFVPAAARDAIAAALAGRADAQIFVYPGADHAFNNPGRPELRQGGGADGAFALDRRAAPGDGAALRSVSVMGAAYGVGIRRAGCRGDDAHDGGAALRQPHPGDDRRRRS